MEHANGVATMAARGARAPMHFVSKVFKGTGVVHQELFKQTRIPGFTQQMSDDESFALQKVLDGSGTANKLKLKSRPAAAKTGTWQYQDTDDNSQAWMVGYIAPDVGKSQYGLATAVWVGNKADEQPLLTKGKGKVFGATLPGPIWRDFMDAATAKMPKTTFPQPKNVGDVDAGDAKPPTQQLPSGPPGDPNKPCDFPIFCPPTGGQGGGNGNGNGGGNGGGGNRNDPFPFPPTPPRRGSGG
jgi:membrane peptidoglycan carboxypeptidase